jgi:hypothetical protein
MGEIAASEGLVMGWLVVPRHVCWSFRQMLSRPGDIQAFAATNHRWGGRECETEEGRASYVPFQCLPSSEPKNKATNPIRERGSTAAQCVFQAGIRNEIGRSLKGGGRTSSLKNWGEKENWVSELGCRDGNDTARYGKIQGGCHCRTSSVCAKYFDQSVISQAMDKSEASGEQG